MTISNEEFMRKHGEIKSRRESRNRRRMELGYDGWQKRENGSFYKHGPKGIQNWYSTRTLINLVSERMQLMETTCGKRFCPINGKWMLQIRGKHLHRLLKAKPQWKQVGRKIIEVKE